MSFAQNAIYSGIASRISQNLGLLTKHHEIFAAVRRDNLGYMPTSLDLDIHPPSPGTLSGSFSRWVGSSADFRVALPEPERASWGNLKTPSNF